MVRQAYSFKLNDVLDRLYIHGVASIPREELMLWYDLERVSKKLWRDVSDSWNKRCREEWEYEPTEVPTLLKAYNPSTRTYHLIFGGEPDEKTGKFEPWFKPLNEVDEGGENTPPGDDEEE